MDEKYLFMLDKEEMKTRVKALTGFEKERDEIKALSKIIFDMDIENIEYMKFLNINGNVLLFGKPGTGKTSICYDCMLENTSASYYQLNMTALVSEKLGKTAQKINEVFEEVLNESKKYPVYLLIEEIEVFLPNRRESKDLEDMKRALTIFMHYLDKINPNLMVMCTTNHLESLDPAIV
ncbi:MAG TPA: AAA family ATPase, partial [Candidatus Ventrimonas merdavium]|nr:AAA family ATPase [Candidatus Ventrimonas merdavium]